jgi:hypothetical protein
MRISNHGDNCRDISSEYPEEYLQVLQECAVRLQGCFLQDVQPSIGHSSATVTKRATDDSHLFPNMAAADM